MDLTWVHIIILITSGLIVGFINTIAGGGTIISLSVLMLLGLPPIVANGTNRVAIIAQNITAVINFHRKKLIDWKKSFKLAIPVVLGTVIGAIIGNHISNDFFKYIFGVIAIFFCYISYFPTRSLVKRKRKFSEAECYSRNAHSFLLYRNIRRFYSRGYRILFSCRSRFMARL